MLTLGSLFDGISGFPLTASRHGIRPIWASEIEPFPIRVSTGRFPNMKHIGDITSINGAEIEPVDIITFGSPCQDLSATGKREGLGGERSHLFFEAVRIINEMRKRTHKCYPSFAIWENVPGAFSSNGGRDFRAVLEALTEAEIPMPKSGRWAEAGMVRGNGREVAWRCLDAQYWGVPQRRKRIFLVVDFGGECAGQILFEPEGLPGYSPEGRKAREEAAAGAGDGTEGTVHPKITGTLCASGAGMSRPAGMASETDLLVIQSIAFNGRQDPVRGTVTGALDTDGPTQCVAIQHSIIGRKDSAGAQGPGYRDDDKMFTLDSRGLPHAVALHVAFGPGGQHEIAHAIRAQASKADKPDSTPYIYEPIAPTLPSRERGGGGLGTDFDCDGGLIAHAVDTRCGTGGNNVPVTHVGYAVRRLTVIECLRLQGFPDNWLDNIPGNSDTACYKAIGNSLAIPCPEWIFKRINEVLYSDIPEAVNLWRAF